MSDYEKFEGFKQKLIDDNEQKYGAEVREKYGDTVIDGNTEAYQQLFLDAEKYHSIQKALAGRLCRELHGDKK